MNGRAIIEIMRLELRSLVRSRTVAMLLLAAVAWVLAFPHIVKGDGTAAGLRELEIHFSLGGVFALLLVSLLSSATGSIASERTAKRLQLTTVRPVWGFAVAFGKMAAHVAVGALVLAVACAVMALRTDLSVRCSHVLKPVLPSVREEARAMYDIYMADTNTPAAVRHAKKSVVLRLLENRAVDRYETIGTNSTASWKFALGSAALADGSPEGLAVRMRFTNQLEMRQDVRGEFRLGPLCATVSNITQAVVVVPLRTGCEATTLAGGDGTSVLEFANGGKTALMFRPRRDIELLSPADAFWRNLIRAYAELLAILALVIAFGVALSAGLGRPVALFVAFVTLVVGEMSPSVIEQYPDELETDVVDRIGLYITRFAADVTKPVSSLSPLERLAKDECVEVGEVVRLAVSNLLVLPVLLSMLSAFLMPRKQEDV